MTKIPVAAFKKLFDRKNLLLHQGIISSALRAATLGGRFVLIAVLGFFFSPAQVGYFGLMMAAVATAEVVISLSFREFSTREVLERSSSTRHALYIRDQLGLHFVIYLLLIPIFVAVVIFHALEWHSALWIFSILLTHHLHNEVRRLLEVFRKPILANACSLLARSAWIAPLTAIWYYIPQTRDLNTIWAGWLIGNVCGIAMVIPLVSKLPLARALRLPIDKSWIHRGVVTSAPYLGAAVATMLSRYVDRFILSSFVSMTQVGVYNFYSMVANGLLNLSVAGSGVLLLPHIVKSWTAGDIKSYRKYLFATLLSGSGGVAFLSVIVAIGLALIFPHMSHAEYSKRFDIYWLLMASLFLNAIANSVRIALYVRRLDGKLFMSNMVSFGSVVVFDLIMIPLWGISGAAWAQVLSQVILLGMRLWYWWQAREVRALT